METAHKAVRAAIAVAVTYVIGSPTYAYLKTAPITGEQQALGSVILTVVLVWAATKIID